MIYAETADKDEERPAAPSPLLLQVLHRPTRSIASVNFLDAIY